jgi:hypothetical protein
MVVEKKQHSSEKKYLNSSLKNMTTSWEWLSKRNSSQRHRDFQENIHGSMDPWGRDDSRKNEHVF